MVVGNFYDKDGKPTAALNKVGESVEAAKLEKELEDDDNKRFPPCNSEWSSAAGSRVWCSDKRYKNGWCIYMFEHVPQQIKKKVFNAQMLPLYQMRKLM